MTKENTIIIDDLKAVYDANINNCVLAPTFSLLENNKSPSIKWMVKMMSDSFLLDVILRLDQIGNDSQLTS